jgi:DNA polymerase I-like protein with 3'-5' exonuclease and polymerase domains
MHFKDHAPITIDFDTLLAHHTLYPRLPHNLGFLTSQYTDMSYYKDEIDTFKEGGDINTFWEYNCKDCCATFAIFLEELKELQDQNLSSFFFTHVMQLQPHLSETTATGILVDIDKKSQLFQSLSEEVDAHLQSFVKKAQYMTKDITLEVNPKSSQQLCKLFYDKLNIKYPRRSVDAKAREDLLKDPRTGIETKDLLTSLGTFTQEQKFFSTYVKTQLDSDNRFRAEFKQYGVTKAPGRLSSSKTLWGSGGNAQNLPHRAYEMYIADPGTVFIYFDLAQAEARYVAWDAWIEQWMEDFEKARTTGTYDAHRALASAMFKIPYDETPKEDIDENGKHTKRFIAKRCRHGLNYRMHIARLAETTGMSYPEAASNYYTYHRTTPELQQWWRDVEREAKRNRVLYNAYGRRFIIMERLENSNIMDSIIAFKPQSSIGDKTQRVWYQCHNDSRWDKDKARIALNVHDALYGFATPEYAKTALSIMKEYAEEPIMVKRTKDGKPHPMIVPADCKISVPDENGIHRMSNLTKVTF